MSIFMSQKRKNLNGVAPLQPWQQPANNMAIDEPAKPSFFGQGGTGRQIAGYIGDALLTASGGAPVYAPAMMQKRQMEAAAQNDMLKRAQDYSDWQRKFDYEQQNKAPSKTALQNNYEYLQQQNPELASQYLQNQTTAPPLVVTNGDGTKTVYPAGAIPRGQKQRPQIGSVMADPRKGGSGSGQNGFRR